MNKRVVLLVCAALVLGCARLFMDWHKQPNIQIFMEKSRRAVMHGSDAPDIVFHFQTNYSLTSIEVVDAEDARTNKYPHALWHLVAADKPVKTESFGYGANIPGMKPQITAAEPEPLELDTKYVLLVEAGRSLKGKLTFQLPY
jgi:hypothetical protein